MLCALLVEAVRYRANTAAPLPKDFVLGLLQDVTEAMCPDEPRCPSAHGDRPTKEGTTGGGDVYIDLLNRIAALSLFRNL